MECTNKKGFILGPNIRLSGTNMCVKETNRKMKLDDGIVETKREFVHEKGSRSKVLSTRIESFQWKKIKEIFKELKIDGVRRVSFERASTEERLSAMH